MFVMVQDGSGKGRVSVSIFVTRITGVGDCALKSPTNACCNASLCPSRPIRIVGLTEGTNSYVLIVRTYGFLNWRGRLVGPVIM